jgi:hypothetical protein
MNDSVTFVTRSVRLVRADKGAWLAFNTIT